MLWSQSPCPSPVLPPSCVALFGDSLTCQSTCQQSRVAVGQNHLALKFDFILWIPSFDRPRPTGQMLKQRGHQRTVNVAVIAAPPSLVPLLPPPCITKRPHVGRSVGRRPVAGVVVGDNGRSHEGGDTAPQPPGAPYARPYDDAPDLFRRFENRNEEMANRDRLLNGWTIRTEQHAPFKSTDRLIACWGTHRQQQPGDGRHLATCEKLQLGSGSAQILGDPVGLHGVLIVAIMIWTTSLMSLSTQVDGILMQTFTIIHSTYYGHSQLAA